MIQNIQRGIRSVLMINFQSSQSSEIDQVFLEALTMKVNNVLLSEVEKYSLESLIKNTIYVTTFEKSYSFVEGENKILAYFKINNYNIPFAFYWRYKKNEQLIPAKVSIDFDQLIINAEILDVELLKEAILDPTKPAGTYFHFTYPEHTWIAYLWSDVFYEHGFDYFKVTDDFIFATADKIKIELEKVLGIKFEKIRNKIWLKGKGASNSYKIFDNHAELTNAAFDTFVNRRFQFTLQWIFKSKKKVIPCSTSINPDEFEIKLIDIDAEGLKDALLKKAEIAKEFDYLNLNYKVRKHFLQLDAQHIDINFTKLDKDKFEEFKNVISKAINNWNKEAENQEHEFGLIHNWKMEYKKGKKVEAYFDFGSSGMYGLTMLLFRLDKFEIEEITLHG